MSGRGVKYAYDIAGVALLTVALTAPALSQAQRPPSDVDPARARFEDNNKREMQLRGMGSGPKKTDPKEIEALAAQIKQDFQRIIALHNLIDRAVGVEDVLDHDFVANATFEVKKRAGRLQTTLALDKLNSSDLNQYKLKHLNDAQLKDTLKQLCKQIESFISNPVIDNPATVNAQQLASARHDLEGVIELADGINKFVDHTKKNNH